MFSYFLETEKWEKKAHKNTFISYLHCFLTFDYHIFEISGLFYDKITIFVNYNDMTSKCRQYSVKTSFLDWRYTKFEFLDKFHMAAKPRLGHAADTFQHEVNIHGAAVYLSVRK